MARSLLQEIAHQIFYKPPKHRTKSKPRNHDLERELYKVKQAAFEANKSLEIAKHHAKSKGWF